MTKEQVFFIDIISDHLNNRTTEAPDKIDWNIIAELSRIHDVEGIVYSQCRNYIPFPLLQHFERASSAAFFLYANRKHAVEEISKEFRRISIDFFTVKGFSISKFYPVPALRTMGDCDLIIKHDRIKDAVEIMKSLGYTPGADVDNQFCFHRGDIEIELHDLLVKAFEMPNGIQLSFFNNDPFQYLNDEVLDESFHFLFVLMHLRKHILSSGAGIRQFADLAVIISECNNLHWDWIENCLYELDLLRFAKFCLCIISNWFGISAPIGCDEIEVSFYETVTANILENGVFGFDNNENKGNNIRNRIINNSSPKWITKLLIIIETVFPSYDNMRWYPGCKYLEGRPILLPFAWFHRIILILKRKRLKNAMDKFVHPLMENNALEQREEFLKKMGI